MSRRTERINSLLKQVISDVIRSEVKNPHLPPLVTITHVDITADLRHAKVYVSVIGEEATKKEALLTLQSAAGFIAVNASKEVRMRYFPALTFVLDDSVDKQMKIETVIKKIERERESRE
ncbi:30S ribosome-binding factor RbfA [Chlamydiota bacterium]